MYLCTPRYVKLWDFPETLGVGTGKVLRNSSMMDSRFSGGPAGLQANSLSTTLNSEISLS